MKLYEKDLDSDVESVDEAPSPRKVVQSPVKMSERERKETIRRVAEMNKVSHLGQTRGSMLIVSHGMRTISKCHWIRSLA